jgi:hypothetical protein
MKPLLTGLILMLLAVPVAAGETRLSSDDDTLNFDLPFEQAINKQVLRSLLNQAIEAVEDHLELKGKWRHGNQAGDREGRFELRLYPRGKSRSDEHVGAEGSFRFSPEAGNHELSLRFKSSKPSSHAPISDPAGFL